MRSWNTSAQGLLVYCEADIIGKSADVFYTPEDIQRRLLSQQLRLAIDSGRCLTARWQVRKDGNRFWDNGNITPLRDDDGVVTGFARIVRDRTDRKLAEGGLGTRLRTRSPGRRSLRKLPVLVILTCGNPTGLSTLIDPIRSSGR